MCRVYIEVVVQASSNLGKHNWSMRETSNCKTLAYTMVCKENENKKKLEKNWMAIKIFRYQLLKATQKDWWGSNTDVVCDDTS